MTPFFIPNRNRKYTNNLVIMATVLLSIIAAGAVIAYRILERSETAKPQPEVVNPAMSTTGYAYAAVTALGRIEPEGEVIQVFPPASTESARIQQLEVKQGDWVKAGQALAVLDNYARRLAAVKAAEEDVKVAQAQLMQVQAGAKQGDLQAQQAEISRLVAELKNAQVEELRYRSLYREGAISASQYDRQRLQMEAAQRQVNQARASLNSLAEVRPVDVQLYQAQVKQTRAKVVQAQAELDLSVVRSPRSGQILKVHTFPGEMVGSQGIVNLGNTTQMVVVAEVYETDIPKVHLGQIATITSPSLTKPLSGKVSQLGLEIGKANVSDIGSSTNIDARVVEVRIALNQESSRIVATMTNLNVDVSIGLEE
ncbi:MAG: ABC exporter membrane fusion protein [Nostoc sp. ChiSLP01]|nr:ABC exporter membrane fusion protein [Nostoc sp. CmiSLP01]MDZ8289218.1 ABC exporter membrane fusion protein [Nostoc sp. ChiSLP01]